MMKWSSNLKAKDTCASVSKLERELQERYLRKPVISSASLKKLSGARASLSLMKLIRARTSLATIQPTSCILYCQSLVFPYCSSSSRSSHASCTGSSTISLSKKHKRKTSGLITTPKSTTTMLLRILLVCALQRAHSRWCDLWKTMMCVSSWAICITINRYKSSKTIMRVPYQLQWDPLPIPRSSETCFNLKLRLMR